MASRPDWHDVSAQIRVPLTNAELIRKDDTLAELDRILSMVDSPEKMIEELGDLHDARLEAVTWSPGNGTVELKLDDLYSNFEGFEEYAGPEPGRVLLVGVRRLTIDFGSEENTLSVYGLRAIRTADGYDVKLEIFPGGELTAACTALKVEAE